MSVLSFNSRGSHPNMRGLHKGHLNVTVQVADNRLSVHVIQAKQLRSKYSSRCSSFVEVSLLPATAAGLKWTSKAIKYSDSPVFDDKFELKLAPNDVNKRLFIAVWNADHVKSEMLGCMSFGIRHLVMKSNRKLPVCGWYHLLSESMGVRKHLLAQDAAAVLQREPSLGGEPCMEPSVREPSMGSDISRDLSRPQTTFRSPCSEGVLEDSASSKLENLQDLDSITVIIHRQSSGFGFTVKNTSPVKVGVVKSRGPAEEAGLKKGDYIIRINGQDVTKATAMVVATITRQTIKTLVLDVRRNTSKSKKVCQKHIKSCPVSHQTSSRQTDQSRISTNIVQDLENMPPFNNGSLSDSNYKSLCSTDEYSCPSEHAQKSSRRVPERKRAHFNKDKKFHENFNSTSVDFDGIPGSKRSVVGRSPTKWDPEISVITTDDSLRSRHVISYCDLHSTAPSFCRGPSQCGTPRSEHSHNLRSHSRQPKSVHAHHETRQQHTGERDTHTGERDAHKSQSAKSLVRMSDSDTSGIVSGPSVSSSPPRRVPTETRQPCDGHCYPDDRSQGSGAGSKSTVDISGLSYYHGYSSVDWSAMDLASEAREMAQTRCRQYALQRLLSCEREFTSMMHSGIQQFSRPLRHCILTTEQHTTLFQNLEKLVALSEYHVRQMTEQSFCAESSQYMTEETSVTDDISIGDIYRPRAKLLCGAYKAYLEGLPAALSLLNTLSDNGNFMDFLKSTNKTGSMLADFLWQPQRHLVSLSRGMTEVLSIMKESYEDTSALCKVIQAFQTSFPSN